MLRMRAMLYLQYVLVLRQALRRMRLASSSIIRSTHRGRALEMVMHRLHRLVWCERITSLDSSGTAAACFLEGFVLQCCRKSASCTQGRGGMYPSCSSSWWSTTSTAIINAYHNITGTGTLLCGTWHVQEHVCTCTCCLVRCLFALQPSWQCMLHLQLLTTATNFNSAKGHSIRSMKLWF
jgi:hypothetical protein